MRTLLKYSLLFICSTQLWGITDNAMATCQLTSASASVSVTQNYTFKTNSNGTWGNEIPMSNTFWSGSGSETYTCPQSSKYLYFCGTDDQIIAGGTNTVLGPGIYGGGYASDGSDTTIDDSHGGCLGLANSGSFPATGTIPQFFDSWKYAGAKVIIKDSTQARNITINNKLVGTIFMTTSNFTGSKIGGSPLTQIYLSGTISIPASCTLASSSTITLPDTYSGEYSKAGAGATIGTGTSSPMSIKCLGGSETATIDLHVTTSKVSGDDIITSNPDVGVRVLDGNGNKVSANNGKLSTTLSDGAVDVPFTYVPVAITGKNPTPGDYSAIETITVTIP
ncbi:TPA: fimbrial protein [Klebsiella michiganensis]